MKRKFTSYPLTDCKNFKTQLLNFGIRFSNFCFLENNGYDFNRSYECVAGVGVSDSHPHQDISNITGLGKFRDSHNDWIFGHVSYDFKNEIEELSSNNFDSIQFPDLFFFIPELVFIISKNEVSIGAYENINTQKIFNEILGITPATIEHTTPDLKSRFTKQEYIETVARLQEHISRGDCYEICFCQEFFAENALVDAASVFSKLNEISPNPFSAFYKYGEKFLMCASPERFLKKTGNEIISQPIKGTAPRILNNLKEDEKQKESLLVDEKERAENIMIVDLVRNDLSKICLQATVKVKEFLAIYSFPQVHQIISTIGGQLKSPVSLEDILKATFPMGSMTGAPKKRAMELIEQYERTGRGLYSGTVGYINPEGDFDFNVVIRSILYNRATNYLSIQAGSAITFKSDPEKEFEECNIKIEAMRRALK